MKILPQFSLAPGIKSVKPPQSYPTPARAVTTLLVGAFALLAGISARAQSYTWDPLLNTVGSDGAGTWDASTAIWASAGVDVAWPNGTNVATIGSDLGAAGTITLSPATIITNNGITFNAPLSGNYVLTGGTNYLVGQNPTITVNSTSATVLSPLQGNSGLVKSGPGTLGLGGTSSYSGSTSVSQGTLQLTNFSGLPNTLPVLYMSFNQTSGSTVTNQGTGGTAMNGTLTGNATISAGAGKFGHNALSIGSGASTAGYLLISSPVVPLTRTTTWTLGMWVQSTTPGGAYAYQGSGGWAVGNTSFYLNGGSAADTAGGHQGAVCNSSGWEEGSAITATNGSYHFLVLVNNAGTFTFYFDGAADAASSSFSGTGEGVGTQMRIGGSGDTGDANIGLNGLISEVYVYNIALSASQVTAVMNASAGPTLPPVYLPPTTALAVSNGATLDMNGQSASVAGLTGTGTVDSSANGAVLGITNATSGTFSGTLMNGAGTLAVSVGPGNLTLPGANTYQGATTVNGAVLNLTGSLESSNATTSIMTIGGSATNAVVKFSGTFLTNYEFQMGAVSNAVGALYQNAGVMDEFAGASGNAIQIGNSVGAYGYYYLAPGTSLFCGEIGVAGEGNSESGFTAGAGNGLMDVNGGTITDTGYVVVSRVGTGAQTGVVNIYSGSTFNFGTVNGGGFELNWGTAGTSAVNVLGGLLTTPNNLPINLNENNNAGNVGILNLDGGVAQAGSVNGGFRNTYVNFNGGTLQAETNQGVYMAGLAGVYVFGSGGTINNNGFNMNIGQPLRAATSNGVYGISSFTGGVGYVAPPIVTIVPGAGDTTGVDATAIAQIDTSSGGPTSGEVTNVIITSPGVNYTATPTFVLTGGGYSTPATITGLAPAANTSGGMTFTGSGFTTLTGALTYGGTTTVTQGTLQVMGEGQTVSTPIVVQDGATLSEAPFANGQWAPVNLTMGSATGAKLALWVGGSTPSLAAGTIDLVGTLTVDVYGNVVAGGVYPLLSYTNLTGSGNFNFVLANGVLGTVTPNIVSGVTTYSLTVSSVTPTIWKGAFNGTWDINTTANWTAPSGSTYLDGSPVQFDDIATDNTGGIYSISNLSATLFLRPSTIYITNGTTPYVFTNTVIIAGGGGITKTGAAAFTNFGLDTYTGPTVISNGIYYARVAAVANASSALGLNSQVTIANVATAGLNISGDSTQLGSLTGGGATGGNVTLGASTLTVGGDGTSPAPYAGAISGTGALTKIGTGTLTLSGNSAYGADNVTAGTLDITGSIVNNNTMTIANSPSNALVVFNGTTLEHTNWNIGTVLGAVGAIYVNSGALTQSQAATGANFEIGDASGAYGYLYVGPGATAGMNEIGVGGEANPSGNGLLEVNGGTVTDTGYVVVARGGSAQTGIVNVYSGTFNYATATGAGFQCNWGTGQTSIVNVMGGLVANVIQEPLNFNNTGSALNTGILNLSGGGVFQASAFTGGVHGFVNFNGGAIQPSEANTGFMTGLGGATVYSGGGTVNDTGYAITIAQPFIGPAGSGVSGITSYTGGAGYIAPPIIAISGGGGSGATAIAQINTNTGVVTNIIITCPGINYTTSPTFAFSGGGATTQAAVTASTLAPNTTGTLTFNVTGGAITLTGVTTVTNRTIVNAGTVTMGAGGSLAGPITISNGGTLSLSATSTDGSVPGNINVATGGIFDQSLATAFVLGNQTLSGSGNVNGSLTTSSTSTIYPGTDPGVGTLTFNNALNLVTGATAIFDLNTESTTDGGNNDEVVVTGALTIGSGESVSLKALSGAANLDSTHDYVLISTPAGFSGSFNAVPIWLGTKPANYAHYVVTNDAVNDQIRLTYTASANPTLASATATPSSGLLRNQPVFFSVTVTPGTAAITNVVLNLSSIGGTGNAALVLSGTPNVWTNTVPVPAGTLAGTASLQVIETDANGNQGGGPVAFGVVASTETWTGASASEDFDTNSNWLVEAGEAASYAPGYVGDSLIFAGNGGTAGLDAIMDNSYTLAGLTFSNNAGSFVITPANSSVLTLSGSGVTNNSSSTETLAVPIDLTVPETFAATAGNIDISGVIASSGVGLSTAGPGTVTLSAANTYTGATTVNSGTLNLLGTLAGNALILRVGSTTTASNAVLQIGPAATIGQMNNWYIGNFSGQSAAVYQTGGAATINGGGGDVLDIGNVAGAYGYYGISGGTISANGIGVAGEGNDTLNTTLEGNGIMEINGGAVTDVGWVVMCRTTGTDAGQVGILNVYSGSLSYEGGGVVCNWGTGQTSIINIMGGLVYDATQEPLNLNDSGNGGNTGVLNLTGGGVLQADQIVGSGGQVNFNGGAVEPSESTPNFMPGAGTATIYAGGATVTNNGYTITNAQGFLNAGGNGLGTVSTFTGGVGYVAPPIVLISGGGGSGATAIAQINPATGVVTNILITCPGQNYTSTPTFTFSGGGAVTPATATAVTLVPNSGGTLSVTGSGIMTLTGNSSYTNTTIVNAATLQLGLTGNITNSAAIFVTNGGIFDLSLLPSYTLSTGQRFEGSGGSINAAQSGFVTTGAGSAVFPGTDGTIGTVSFTGGLTMAAGSTANFDLTTSATGVNDQIQVSGTLSVAGNSIHIKAPNTGVNLDTTSDYTLITASSISGAFSTTPVWDVKPVNYKDYTVQTSGNSVILHYSLLSPPTGVGSATPSANVLRNQNVLLSVTVTPGSTPTMQSVTVDATSLGGPVVSLVQKGATSVWTNTLVIPPTALPQAVLLSATITDTAGLIGTANVSFTIVASTETWDGLGSSENFDTNQNWVVQAGEPGASAPGYVGDSLLFAGNGGTAGANPNMDNNYTVAGLSFSNNAASFNIGSANSSTLTLASSAAVSNNSSALQTLNVPITMSAAVSFSPGAGGIAIPNALSGATAGVGLTVNGNGVLTLSGANNYTGPTAVSQGALNISASGSVSTTTSGATVANVASNAVLDLSGSLTSINCNIGNVAGAVGAVYQTGAGTLTLTTETAYEAISVGNIAGSYGYYYAGPGTTITTYGLAVAGENYPSFSSSGNGVMDINGATVANNGWIVMTRGGNTGTGVLNMYSGSLTYEGGGFVVNWGTGQTCVLNVMGGDIYNPVLESLNLNDSGSASNTGILNLIGSGIFQAASVIGGVHGFVNFNGGSLEPSQTTTAFMGGLGGATIYSGGAVITNNGLNITIAQPFLAPAGNGVNSIGSFTGGAGYIAPPIVTIITNVSDTTGSGATAIAQINPATGVVTNILITSPGINYTAVPTFILTNGGASTPATVTGAAPTPNTGGGLTSTGSGVLTLTGASTYTGPTVVASGTLALGVGGSISSSSVIDATAGATFDVSALTGYSVAAGQTLRGSGTVNGNVTVVGTLSAGEAAAIGSLSMNGGNLTLQGTTSLRINNTGGVLTSDQVTTIGTAVYGGALVVTNTGTTKLAVGNTFTLFPSTTSESGSFATISDAAGDGFSFNATTGVLTVTYVDNPTPTPLTFSLSGNNLNLSWPADHKGWTLLYQSNSLSVGLQTNASAWLVYPGSTNVDSEVIPISKTNEIFFQLLYP